MFTCKRGATGLRGSSDTKAASNLDAAEGGTRLIAPFQLIRTDLLNTGLQTETFNHLVMDQYRAVERMVRRLLPPSRRRLLLRLVIPKLQSLAEGDLSEQARARTMEIAGTADIRRRSPDAPDLKSESPKPASNPVPVSLDNRVPIPDSLIAEKYRERLRQVLVSDEGLE